MTKEDPWSDLAPDRSTNMVHARRADASLQWDFYWATYGSAEYDRPKSAPKGWFGHKHFNPTQSSNPKYKMMGSGQI